MRNNIINAIKVSVLALALSFGLSFVYAWTAPTVAAPGGNVAAPINTSATAQTKNGSLTVDTISATTHCIGADCRTVWPSGGIGNVSGSGFTNYIPVWSGSNSLTYSSLFDFGSTRGIYENGDICYTLTNGGTNYCLSKPSGGMSPVGINAAPLPGFVTSITAGAGITVSPASPATGAVTVSAAPAAGSGLGYGQTWQNMKASRLLGAANARINSTGKPIEVCVNSTGSNSAYGYVYFYVDGFLISSNNSDYATYGKNMSACGIVPPGSSYYAVITAGSYDNWMELR